MARTRRTGRVLAALLALAGFATLSVGSAADRLSGGNRAASALVPGFQASASLREAAGAALEGGDLDRAGMLSAAALRAAPADPAALSLVASTALAKGEDDRAFTAFSSGAAMGWSDPVTQAYWFEQSAAQGEASRAALHLDALLRLLPAERSVQIGIDRVLAMPGGDAALLERLKERPSWRSAVLGGLEGIGAAALQNRAALVAQAVSAGAIRCEEAAGFGAAVAAAGLSLPACPPTP